MAEQEYNLDDEFSDDLDYINDELTAVCDETLEKSQNVLYFVEKSNEILRTKNLNLDSNDLESLSSKIEEPSEDEAISFDLPIYLESNEESEYRLFVIYYKDIDDNLSIDMEVRYAWEQTNEIDYDEEDDQEDSTDYELDYEELE